MEIICLESDKNRTWKLRAVPSENVYREIVSCMADVERMDIDVVGRSELPTSRTALDSHANMFIVKINVQIISDADRTVEISSFTPDYE